MMRIQKYLIVFVVILSFVSCKGTDEESCSIIDFDEAQVMTEQELFSKVEIISLQNKDDLILSNVSQIIVEEPYILIKDSKNVIYEPTLKSKACLKCLYFTKIISDLCRYLEYFSYLCIINQTERQCLKRQIRILS